MSENLNTIWASCLSIIKEELNDKMYFENFFEDSKLLEIKDSIAIIVVASPLEKKYFESTLPYLEEVLLKVSETDFKIKIMTESEYQNSSSHQVEMAKETNSYHDNLNREYLFDNFVIGPSNKESYQAAIAVCSKPGKLFNPLFIYGNSGLGKTHLIHSIGNLIKENKPNMRILYVTSEEFYEDYIDVARQLKGKTNEWFDLKYRDLDILIVDDIQFLRNKEKSNEKFFHVYNDLFRQNKQIIITSDVMPKQLDGLEQRLVSRFIQGLTVSINKPEYETRLQILKCKLKYLGEEDINFINDEALAYIAEHFINDVRDLEGALRRLIFYSINFNNSRYLSMDIIKEAFADIKIDSSSGNITEQKILKTICNYYNLTKNDLIGKSRNRIVATPRHIAIFLTRQLLETPYDKIGKIYGNRDHSTIMNSYHKINKLLEANNLEYKTVIKELKDLLIT
ncbi:MAG: chromosomal replication initiator protein DnaA [Bacilli bacterium]